MLSEINCKFCTCRSLFFNADGTIQKVVPTLRGVGVTDAGKKIQIDRYSAKSDDGVTVDFIDTANRFEGWKTIFSMPGSWIQYNTVDFGKNKLKSLVIRAVSSTGGTLQIHTDNIKGPLIGNVEIPATNEWKEIKIPISAFRQGIHHIVVSLKTGLAIEVDWLYFE